MTSWLAERLRTGAADSSGEADRNRALRRIDWRFLLSDPAPRRCLSWANSTLSDSLRRISPEVSESREPGTAGWDLVVDDRPCVMRIQDAFRVLRPGGEYTARWRLLGPSTRREARRMLERAGFDDVRFYWMWPADHRQSPQFWLSVERSLAVEWFFNSRSRGRGALGRVKARTQMLGWHFARRAGLLPRVWVLARKPGGASAARAAPQILLTGGHRSINKIVGLASRQPGSIPDTVLKMARTPEASASLAAEARVLEALPPRLVGVPRLLNYDAERSTLAETLLAGEPMLAFLSHQTLEPLAMRATAWLCDLAADTLGPSPDHVVESITREFEQQWGPILEASQWQTALSRLERLRSLPSVCEHRDFAPWNVLLGQRGELLVLDWESAVPHGVPGLDLIYFLTYAVFFVSGAMRTQRYRSAYAELLNRDTPFGGLRHACLERYLGHIQVPRDTLSALGLLTWMLHARSEYRRITEDWPGPPSADRLRGGLFWQLWQEELRRAG